MQNQVFFLISMLLLLASCSREDSIDNIENSELITVRLDSTYSKYFDSTGEHLSRIYYRYGNENKITEVVSYTDDRAPVLSKYEYDVRGNIVSYTKEGALLSSSNVNAKLFYEKDLVVRVEKTREDGCVFDIMYEYDNDNHLTKKLVYDRNDNRMLLEILYNYENQKICVEVSQFSKGGEIRFIPLKYVYFTENEFIDKIERHDLVSSTPKEFVFTLTFYERTSFNTSNEGVSLEFTEALGLIIQKAKEDYIAVNFDRSWSYIGKYYANEFTFFSDSFIARETPLLLKKGEYFSNNRISTEFDLFSEVETFYSKIED